MPIEPYSVKLPSEYVARIKAIAEHNKTTQAEVIKGSLDFVRRVRNLMDAFNSGTVKEGKELRQAIAFIDKEEGNHDLLSVLEGNELALFLVAQLNNTAFFHVLEDCQEPLDALAVARSIFYEGDLS